MEEQYERLGFEYQKILENPYGIRIYLGTKGKEDWCIEIPKKFINAEAKEKNLDYVTKVNFSYINITEKHALQLAEKYTSMAKRMKM